MPTNGSIVVNSFFLLRKNFSVFFQVETTKVDSIEEDYPLISQIWFNKAKQLFSISFPTWIDDVIFASLDMYTDSQSCIYLLEISGVTLLELQYNTIW